MNTLNVPRLRISRDVRAHTRSYRRIRVDLYEPLMAPLERTLFSELRAKQLGEIRGFGLEIGIGTGLSLSHYSHDVQLIGAEPMAEMAAKLAEKMPVYPLLAIVRASCERLPFDTHSFDFVVGQFVCCSVADPARAIHEMHRVLKPGGQLRLLEHVRSDRPQLGRFQDTLAPFWSKFAFGCRLNGEVRQGLVDSEFRKLRIDSNMMGLLEIVTAMA